MTEQPLRFDAHVHTEASYDADGSARSVLEVATERGLDAVAVTDHDTVAAVPEALALAETYDIVVVPGVEVSTAQGHLLALGVERRPPVGEPVADTVAWVRDRDGVTVVPHPFQRSRHGIPKRSIPDVDAIEAFNALSMTGLQNVRARGYAAREGLPTVAGSDAHRPDRVGRAQTVCKLAPDSPVTREGVLAAIRAGRTEIRGRSVSLGAYVGKYTRSVRRRTQRSVSRRVFGAD